MYVDASAIVGILGRETDADALLTALDEAATPLRVSPLALFEATLGLAGKKARANRSPVTPETIDKAHGAVTQFAQDIGADEIVITREMGLAAIEAARRYGRAVGSPADLNFGDCFAYAAAKTLGIGLVYKGADFSETDLA